MENFVFADHADHAGHAGHIAYWHTGTIPLRARGVDPRLPSPGDGRYDWRGYLSPRLWPSVVDPAQGWLASWNNKPSFAWPDAGDGTLWGTTQRVREPMSLLSSAGRVSPAAMWGIARRTGELDLRAKLGFKPFLTSLLRRRDLTPVERHVVSLVASWDGTAFYPGAACGSSVCGAGFPIMEAWFRALEARAGARVFGSVVGSSDVAAVCARSRERLRRRAPSSSSSTTTTSSRTTCSQGARGAAYDVGGVARAALDDAIEALTRAQGRDPEQRRAALPQIAFEALDVGSIGTIPWENRGTWGQVVVFG